MNIGLEFLALKYSSTVLLGSMLGLSLDEDKKASKTIVGHHHGFQDAK